MWFPFILLKNSDVSHIVLLHSFSHTLFHVGFGLFGDNEKFWQWKFDFERREMHEKHSITVFERTHTYEEVNLLSLFLIFRENEEKLLLKADKQSISLIY